MPEIGQAFGLWRGIGARCSMLSADVSVVWPESGSAWSWVIRWAGSGESYGLPSLFHSLCHSLRHLADWLSGVRPAPMAEPLPARTDACVALFVELGIRR